MNRPLTVLLVEDDITECTRFEDYIDGLDDVHLVAITNDAEKALEHAIDFQPDAIILDLELHQGSGDGLSFLYDLRQAVLPYSPYILITTGVIHPMTHEQARDLGAAFIMVKRQAKYSAEGVVDFLRKIKSNIQDSRNKVAPAPDLPGAKEKRLLTRIVAEMDYVGISPKLIGRNYLIEYILILIEKSSDNPIVEISRRHGKTEKSVKNAMQNAINVTWYNTDIDDLEKHYTARIRSDKGVPTIAELVYYYRDKILMK
ncbi:MAG: response regulator [Oscillospiraceae bacterium]|nr:response regulator [Oscillospiraceae bacterium]